MSLDKDLIKMLDEEKDRLNKERDKDQDEISRSDIIQDAIGKHLGLERHETLIQVPGPPVWKRKRERAASKRKKV